MGFKLSLVSFFMFPCVLLFFFFGFLVFLGIQGYGSKKTRRGPEVIFGHVLASFEWFFGDHVLFFHVFHLSG